MTGKLGIFLNLIFSARRKINDHYSFPFELNMEPYTQEFNRRMDNQENKNSEAHLPKGYYQYKLKGVLLHSGSSDSGHYTSLIYDRFKSDSEHKWFEFNDSKVTPFNPDDMPNEAFGGQTKSYTSIKIKK